MVHLTISVLTLEMLPLPNKTTQLGLVPRHLWILFNIWEKRLLCAPNWFACKNCGNRSDDERKGGTDWKTLSTFWISRGLVQMRNSMHAGQDQLDASYYKPQLLSERMLNRNKTKRALYGTKRKRLGFLNLVKLQYNFPNLPFLLKIWRVLPWKLLYVFRLCCFCT